MAFGMAGNLFQLNHNFLTHKCPSLSTKRHLFKHTEIYGPSEMIAYAPQDIFQSLSAPVRLCTCKKKMRPDQNYFCPGRLFLFLSQEDLYWNSVEVEVLS